MLPNKVRKGALEYGDVLFTPLCASFEVDTTFFWCNFSQQSAILTSKPKPINMPYNLKDLDVIQSLPEYNTSSILNM